MQRFKDWPPAWAKPPLATLDISVELFPAARRVELKSAKRGIALWDKYVIRLRLYSGL